jgi:hypothetical protein
MTIAHCIPVATEQPRLRIEHRVLVAPAGVSDPSRNPTLEKLLDDFYGEHGPAWELVNVFRIGASDMLTDAQQLMFVFQRRHYQAAAV